VAGKQLWEGAVGSRFVRRDPRFGTRARFCKPGLNGAGASSADKGLPGSCKLLRAGRYAGYRRRPPDQPLVRDEVAQRVTRGADDPAGIHDELNGAEKEGLDGRFGVVRVGGGGARPRVLGTGDWHAGRELADSLNRRVVSRQ